MLETGSKPCLFCIVETTIQKYIEKKNKKKIVKTTLQTLNNVVYYKCEGKGKQPHKETTMKTMLGKEMTFNYSFRIEFTSGEIQYLKGFGTETDAFNAMNEFCYSHSEIKSIYRNGENITSTFID